MSESMRDLVDVPGPSKRHLDALRAEIAEKRAVLHRPGLPRSLQRDIRDWLTAARKMEKRIIDAIGESRDE